MPPTPQLYWTETVSRNFLDYQFRFPRNDGGVDLPKNSLNCYFQLSTKVTDRRAFDLRMLVYLKTRFKANGK